MKAPVRHAKIHRESKGGSRAAKLRQGLTKVASISKSMKDAATTGFEELPNTHFVAIGDNFRPPKKQWYLQRDCIGEK